MGRWQRERARRVLNSVFSAALSPVAFCYRQEKSLVSEITRRRLISSYGGALALFPGFSGDLLRRAFYRKVLTRMHESATISSGAVFSSDDVEIAEGVYIGSGSIVGRSRIGRNVLISDYVVIIPGRHTHHHDQEGELDRHRPGDEIPIHIGDNAWIGAHAVVMADVGARSVVGAGAVVVRSIPDDVVAVGNPARVVKRRAGG